MSHEKNKKSGIRITPMEGRFFDIKPPEKYFQRPISAHKKEFSFFVILALVIFLGLNISNIYSRTKDIVVNSKGAAITGYDALKKGADFLVKGDIQEASAYFKRAEEDFETLGGDVFLVPTAGVSPENDYFEAARKLSESAILAARAGQKVTGLIEGLSTIPQKFSIQDSDTKNGIVPVILEEKKAFDNLRADILTIRSNLSTINPDVLPLDMKTKLETGKEGVEMVSGYLEEVDRHFGAVLKLLGDKVPQRYLVLLQNNHELRAGGGFIGSYLIVDVNDGKITKMEAKDVYESDGWLTDQVTPPAGINQVADRWYMRDANYSPDFPTSAEKVMWFLEHSRGPSADTVIAINQNVVESVLEVLGPVHSPNFPFQIRADNFNQVVSFYTEAKISDTATPKQLLFDLVPVISERFMTMEDLAVLKERVLMLIASRDIQLYSKDPEVESFFDRLGVDGAMPEPDSGSDFLAMVTTSVGGNKSDHYIKTDIVHETGVGEEERVTDTLSITKHHTWTEGDFTGWKELAERYGTGKESLKTLRFIQGEGANKDYMRVYVPKGSTLISATGVEIKDMAVTEDLGYTVFGFNFSPVSPGAEQTVTLKYTLPGTLSGPYRLFVRKQAGAENITLKKTLNTANGMFTKEAPSSTDPFSLSPNITIPFDEDWVFDTSITKK